MLEAVPTLCSLRALIAGTNAPRRALLQSLLSAFGLTQLYSAADSDEACALVRTVRPNVMIVSLGLGPEDGIGFARHLRHDEMSPNPYIPIIMVLDPAEQCRIPAARDAGVNAVLAAPITAQNLQEHLIEIIENPRPYIRVGSYFGPDRRRAPREQVVPYGDMCRKDNFAA